ncbi:MAG: FHA domain-containing protein [Demequinaceae bacterium]|nr:FHA domain-containing protein [Demequinaceae bacterium]
MNSDSSSQTTVLIAVLVVWGLVGAGIYAWYGFALSRLFPKLGSKRWKGWVPVVNEMEILTLGEVAPWIVALYAVPGANIYALIMRFKAASRINAAFGRGEGLTVLSLVVPPLWATILASSRPISAASRIAPAMESGSVAPRENSHAQQSGLATPTTGANGHGQTPPGAALGSLDALMGGNPAPLTATEPAALPDVDAAADGQLAAPPTTAVDGHAMEYNLRVSPYLDAPMTTGLPPERPAPPALPEAVEPPALPTFLESQEPPSLPEAVEPPALPTFLESQTPPSLPVLPALVEPYVAPAFVDQTAQPVAVAPVVVHNPWAPRADNDAPAPAMTLTPVTPPPPPTPPAPAAPVVPLDLPPIEPPVEPPMPGAVPVPSPSAPPAPPAPRAPALVAVEEEEEDDDDGETVVVDRRPRILWRLTVDGVGDFPLTSEHVLLGRKPSATSGVQALAIPDTTRTLSKVHARLDLVDGAWAITDLNSTNGVVIPSPDGTEQVLQPGEMILVPAAFLLGKVTMSINFEGSPS